MVKRFTGIAASAIIVSLSLWSSAPVATAADSSDIDEQTLTADFLVRCAADEFWCGGQIESVQIVTMLNQTMSNQPHSFCVPKKPDSQTVKSWVISEGVIVSNRVKQMGDLARLTPFRRWCRP